jgi:hypothetical protein
MEDKIFDIVTDLLRNDITKDEAVDKLVALHGSSSRLFHFKYHNSYAIFDRRSCCIPAANQKEAINYFWIGKNKEDWEIASISLSTKHDKNTDERRTRNPT